jgi:glycosyltransferase involved in cell wall biosynthesis
MSINLKITTVTITYNNRVELTKTLNSLVEADCKPFEIIVVDGGSTDGSVDIIKSFTDKLPQMKYTSEKDGGIYDATNIGKRQVSTPLVHFLNAGDAIYGNPYKGIDQPCLIPVRFIDEDGNKAGSDRVKLFGTAYNHQGILLPAEHEDYDTSFSLAADYKMMLKTFPLGLSRLPVVKNGGAEYQLGGLSSQKPVLGLWEMVVSVFQVRPMLALPVTFILVLKLMIPRRIRRLTILKL